MTSIIPRFIPASALGQAAALVLLLMPQAASAQATGWPDKVTGRYKITFNGIEIGKFRFESTADARGYALEANAKMSLLLGAFKWSGQTKSTGSLRGDQPRPVDYTFEFDSSSKSGSVAMDFNNGGVTRTVIEPPSKPSQKAIPVEDKHLKGVLDPLSAVLVMSRGKSGNPCDQTLPIFDGKQRFDLVFTPAGRQRITETKPSGEPEMAYVCKVRYVPIAGHKDNKSTRENAKTEAELVLRPVPSAGIFVPYQVKIPSFAGSAMLVSERVEITTGADQIALVH
jgi:hypothetical protein